MNVQDRKVVIAANLWLDDLVDTSPAFKLTCNASAITDLLKIIGRLDEQLAGIKEAGKPIKKFLRYFPKRADDYVYAYRLSPNENPSERLELGQLRRLAEALNKLEEVKG